MNAGENSFQNTESCCRTKGDYLLLVLLIRTKISGFLLQERFTGIDSPMVRAETPWSRSCREGAVWCFLKNMVRQVWWEWTLERTLILWCPFQPHPWHYVVFHPASLFFPIFFFFFPSFYCFLAVQSESGQTWKWSYFLGWSHVSSKLSL